MNNNRLIIGIGILIFLLLVILLQFKIFHPKGENSIKPVVDRGIQIQNQRYYGKKRILISDEPEKYEFPLGAKWAFWYDDPSKGIPFEIRYSLDSEPILSSSNFSHHVPTDIIWVSKVPNTKSQYGTFMYTFD